MSYPLGGKRFKTATAISDYARIILHRSLPGFALEGEDAAFVADLFSNPPKARCKAGPGISFDNFSIKKCVASLTRTP
ncbi:MAG: hypothetical protein Q3999_03300 [Buchananella hordeovulneris]|nr:hypothetical protein [Buchananella hordeovulneris]